MGISEEDSLYLEWLDDHERDTQKMVSQLKQESDDTPAHQLMEVNDAINAIEREADRYSGENRFLFLGLSELDSLISKKWKLRNIVLSKCLPDREQLLTDAEIEHARTVPLYKVIHPLPKNRFILCPYHKEKTPSFKVFERGYCFGCGVSVDAIKWLMDEENYSFMEAVKRLNGNTY
jgi:hypothetical protein